MQAGLKALKILLTVTWDRMLIITGDTNFDLLKPEDNLVKQYSGILDVFGPHQVIKQPTHVTRLSRTLIDHLITNQPMQVTASGIIPCSIVSNHDSLYACINVRVPHFEPRYKFKYGIPRVWVSSYLLTISPSYHCL